MTKTALLDSRAVFFWGILLVSLAWSASPIAHGLACLVIPSLFIYCNPLVRAGLFALGVLGYFLGPHALPFIVPVALALVGFRDIAVRALLVLVVATILAHHLEGIDAVDWLLFHPGSAGFIIFPFLIVVLVFGHAVGWRFVLYLSGIVSFTMLIVNAGGAHWFSPSLFSSDTFRLTISIIPILITTSLFIDSKKKELDVIGVRWLLGGVLIGVIIIQLIPVKTVTSIVFDESHGEWETVKSSYLSGDFGRGVNYTYSLLYQYAGKLIETASYMEKENRDLPSNGVFVLKMPTEQISESFSDRLEEWVKKGGRLLIVSDHTDLYDSTQNINAFLEDRFGFKVNSDAVFDYEGMPNHVTAGPVAALFGDITATGKSFHWQTGASLGRVPINTVALARYGLSYSEHGDYSRQNRFGTFIPNNSFRYTDHVAVAAASAGKGAVVIVLDSTPWSNFSIFKESYRHLFRGVIHVLERPTVLAVAGWGGIVLAGLVVLMLFFRHRSVYGVIGLCLGGTLTALIQIGYISWFSPVEDRDYGLRVVVGEAARLEFLKQLILPGERNYSRIVSAMAKYGLDPSASEPGKEKPDLDLAKRWLLIEPDIKQLPSFQDVIEHLRESGDLTVMFSPDQVGDAPVRAWLSEFGIFITKISGLTLAEDMRPGILNREGVFLLRNTRLLTRSLGSSLLKEFQSDPLFQSYTVRPTDFPRKSGLLTIGFSADQFSDDAVGDIWEGVRPSSIGKHREQQLATALTGKEYLPLFPRDLVVPKEMVSGVNLPAFALIEDGSVVMSGKFDDFSLNDRLSPRENPVGYLAELQNRSTLFIENYCPKVDSRTTCSKRLLGPNMMEWLVSWVSNEDGSVAVIELLHTRRFSGLGKTVNVIFGA